MFTPITDVKNKRKNSGDICLKVNGFANFFTTMADGIGRDHVSDHVENDLRNHNSLLNTSTNLTELAPALAVDRPHFFCQILTQ